jgi:hypothetical protein
MTSYDGTKIKGTFNFSAVNISNQQDVISVTNGTFELIISD